MGDYTQFTVDKIEYYYEGPYNLPEVVISLKLDRESPEDEKRVVKLLLEKYGWERNE